MRAFCVVVGLLLTAAVASTPASPPNHGDSAANEVLAAENARAAATISADVSALDKILADDLTYIHASGKVDTKASFIAAIRSGEIHYFSWTPKKLNVRVAGDAAVVDGEYLVHVTDRRVKPDPFDVNIFILAMYARRNGRWQQIAWQSTRDVVLSPQQCQ
jgi:ketosteroid isomerase-like protein